MKTPYNKLIGLLATAVIGLTLSSCGGGGGGGDKEESPSTDNSTTSNTTNSSINNNTGSTSSNTPSFVQKIGPTSLVGKSLAWQDTIQGVKGVQFTGLTSLLVQGTSTKGTYSFTRGNDARSATLIIRVPALNLNSLTFQMEFQNSTTATTSSVKATLGGSTNLNLPKYTLTFK